MDDERTDIEEGSMASSATAPNGDTQRPSLTHSQQLIEHSRKAIRRLSQPYTIKRSLADVRRSEMVRENDQFMKRFSTRSALDRTDVRKESASLDRAHHCCRSIFRRCHIVRVVPPDSAFLFHWLLVVSASVVYNYWALIAREGFGGLEETYGSLWLVLDLCTDAVCVMDIYVQLRTGYLEHGLVVAEPRLLAARYRSSYKLHADVLSLLPLDYVARLVSPTVVFHPLLLRSPRLLKTYRITAYYYTLETRTSYPNMIRVAHLTHILLLGCHWFACFHHMLADWQMSTSSEQWFGHETGGNTTILSQYLHSLYWSTLTLTMIGNSSGPSTDLEYAFTIFSYLLGVFVFATIVGQVSNVITNRNASRLHFERLLDGSKQYMRVHHVPAQMQKRVRRWGRMTGGADLQSLSVLPDKFKTELALHVNLDTLKKVTIFKDCQPEFLHDLVLKMHSVIFTPGDIICRRGEVAREMYIVSDGILDVINDDGAVLRQLHCGDFFGEIGILNLYDGSVNRRTADVRAVGYAELFSLSRDDVLEATKDYPQAREMLVEYGNARLANSCRSTSSGNASKSSAQSPKKTVKWEEGEEHGQTRSRCNSNTHKPTGRARPSPVTNLLGCAVDKPAESTRIGLDEGEEQLKDMRATVYEHVRPLVPAQLGRQLDLAVEHICAAIEQATKRAAG